MGCADRGRILLALTTRHDGDARRTMFAQTGKPATSWRRLPDRGDPCNACADHRTVEPTSGDPSVVPERHRRHREGPIVPQQCRPGFLRPQCPAIRAEWVRTAASSRGSGRASTAPGEREDRSVQS